MTITKGEIRVFLKANKVQALTNLNTEYEPLIKEAALEITNKFKGNVESIKSLAASLYAEIDVLYKEMAKDINIGCDDYKINGLWEAEKLCETNWEHSIIKAMTVNNKFKQLKYEFNQKQDEIKGEYEKLDRMIARTNSTKQILTSLEALGFDTTKIEASKRQNALLVINADKDKLFYPNKQN